MNESEGPVGGKGETQGRQNFDADPGASAFGTSLEELGVFDFLLGEDRSTLGKAAAGRISGFHLFRVPID
jgi:hypothetical protein